MRFSAFLGSMLAAAYVANPVKKAARGCGPNGEVIYVPSAKWVDRSCYRPHQGRQEMARRVRQMKKVAG